MANTNVFEDLLLPDVPHSNFDLSYNNKFSFNIGQITPILCKECLPGDRWQINTKPFIRTMPLLAPIMDKVNVDVRYFFVPNRIIWNEWEDFITGGKDGTARPIQPHITTTNMKDLSNSRYDFSIGSVWDFLGYPVYSTVPSVADYKDFITQLHTANPRMRLNTLPVRALAQIWNDYFQDRNFLANPEVCDFSKSSGNELTLQNFNKFTDLFLRFRVASLKDYFTSALPFAQRGQEVQVPLVGTAKVYSNSIQGGAGVAANWKTVTTPTFTAGLAEGRVHIGNVDMTETGSTISINELRELSALQRYYETNARGGSRYVEQLLARWNVVSPDSRLQRAEYLGGSRAPLMISEVMQNAPFEGQSGEQPLGTLGGKAISSDSCYIEHYCYEHGWIVGLMYVRPEQTYYQGINKQLTRELNTDYYLPEFANLGEQEIKKHELYAIGDGEVGSLMVATDNSGEATFGYTPRYSEYKWFGNELHGDFKDTLRYWTMSRELNQGNTNLNTSFIRPTSSEFTNAFAVQDNSPKLLAQVNHFINCRRSMPMFPVPELK